MFWGCHICSRDGERRERDAFLRNMENLGHALNCEPIIQNIL